MGGRDDPDGVTRPFNLADMAEPEDLEGATVNIDVDELNKVAPDSTNRNRAYLIVLVGDKVGQMIKVGEAELVLGRSSKVGMRIEDDGISRQHCRLRQVGDYTLIEDLGSRNGTFVNGEPVLSQPLKDGDKIRIGSTTILKFTYQDDLDETFQKNLLDAALRDQLTGAMNRKHLMERFDAELKFAQRHGTPLALLVVDLDHFKRVNDTEGHLTGDQVLRTVARRIKGELRTEDIFGRYGGEEFCVLCRGITSPGAAILAERLRAVIAATPVTFEDRQITVTASFGIAAFPAVGAQTPEELFKHADEALYEAKEHGRNCIRSRPA